MSYTDGGSAIRGRFDTEWAGATPVAWPNVNFTPPERDPWVRLSILDADAAQMEIGAVGERNYRHTGIVAVQVFVKANTGDKRARELADSVCTIFRGVTADGIRYGTPYVTEGGPDGKGWWQLNVWCPFWRDDRF